MKPLPTQFLFRSALAHCALILAATASAREPWDAVGPPAEFPALQVNGPAADASAATFPWTAPPLPPLPGADLWEDYQRPVAGSSLHAPRCKHCRGHQPPLLSLVGDALDGFLSLLSHPARTHHQPCHACESALAHCGCQPPASPLPDLMLQQPPNLPSNVIPRPLPPPDVDLQIEKPSAEPQRLYPGRAPVIELAPDPVLPGLPPRNQIPPVERPPRNAIPAR